MQRERSARQQPRHRRCANACEARRHHSRHHADGGRDAGLQKHRKPAGDDLHLRPRHGAQAVRRDVEGDDVGPARIAIEDIAMRVVSESDVVERRHSLRHVAAEHADMADRERFGCRVHRDLGVVDAVDPGRADDAARADAVQRVGQFRLAPELRQQRHDQPGAHRRQHRQRRLDRVRQLDCDDRSRRQRGIKEMRSEVGDGAIGLRVGQPARRLAGHALLVDRVGERVGVRFAGDAAAEQIVERRRAGHGIGYTFHHHVIILVSCPQLATRFQGDCRSAPSVSAFRRAPNGRATGLGMLNTGMT